MDIIKEARELVLVLVITLVLYTLICFIFQSVTKNHESAANAGFNSNIIRATYPNYQNESFDYARTIFEEYSAPSTEYRSFIAFRRKEFSGNAVTIDIQGFRGSTNHRINDSVWFLGGSTMWGTGADDARTIPSYFADKTGEHVLNLGESGFHSLQELIQMQLLLSEGFSPKEVIFYDGVNDGYYFCQRDSNYQIRHAYTSRWQTLDSDLAKAQTVLNKNPIVNVDRLHSFLFEFYSAPINYFRKIETEKENRTKHTSSTPLNEIEPTKTYLHCADPDYARKAANILLMSWRSAAAILNERNIRTWFILQPVAAYYPDKHELDYIIDYEKQRIVNEAGSYRVFYNIVASEFKRTCSEYSDCNSFLNLSDLFFELEENFFIDSCHLSPNGNELVADALVRKLRR